MDINKLMQQAQAMQEQLEKKTQEINDTDILKGPLQTVLSEL